MSGWIPGPISTDCSVSGRTLDRSHGRWIRQKTEDRIHKAGQGLAFGARSADGDTSHLMICVIDPGFDELAGELVAETI